jgi:hypothetical protein
MTTITSSTAIIAIVAALALFGAAIVTIPLQQQAYAQATTPVKINERTPFEGEFFVECAADGAGEVVQLTGEHHFRSHAILDSAGGTHIQTHSNIKLIGTGLTTGDKYQGVLTLTNEVNVKKGIENTFVEEFNIIGQGNGNNFLAHITLHFTFNADGTATAEVLNIRDECK